MWKAWGKKDEELFDGQARGGDVGEEGRLLRKF